MYRKGNYKQGKREDIKIKIQNIRMQSKIERNTLKFKKNEWKNRRTLEEH